MHAVAKEGALAELAAAKPGAAGSARGVELEQAKAEVALLSEAVKELAVKLALAVKLLLPSARPRPG